jgi:hypothetical protein
MRERISLRDGLFMFCISRRTTGAAGAAVARRGAAERFCAHSVLPLRPKHAQTRQSANPFRQRAQSAVIQVELSQIPQRPQPLQS